MFLRNPIDRAYSHFVMQHRAGHESASFEEILHNEMKELPDVLDLFRRCFNQDSCQLQHCLEPPVLVHKHRLDMGTKVLTTPVDLKHFMFTSYLSRSIYVDQVERYLTMFPRENILIMESDEFYSNEQQVLDQIADFLSIPRFDYTPTGVLKESWGGGASNTHHPHDYQDIHPDTRQKLQEFFEPYNQQLYSLIGKNFGWK